MTLNNRNALRQKCASRSRSYSLAMLVLICTSQLLLIAGCHRGFYRRQADTEARRLIMEKTGSRWNSATGDVTIDPMSRMFDPFSADHPPIPPDDPAAHKLMHNVDQKPGYPHWHANGNIDQVENPTWRSYLPTNEKGEVILSLSDAYRLALIHSPDLQQQRETLYLSALEVSIQRFGFDSQLFSGFNSFLTSRGRFQGGGGSSTTLESSLGANGGGLQARRLGITGANFVVGLANTILWEFAGNNTQSANSLINFSVIQPLLRGAGRERIMESLTQSERTLLANVRQLERFRRGFYLEIATGRNSGAGPSQNSSSFLNQPGLSGANVGGYIGLLQQKQEIKNIEFGVAQFESLLTQFSELFRSDRISKLQVTQFESSVYSQQQQLLNAKIAYQSALDRFKVSIGLPQDVQIVIEDPFLDAFNLIDDRFPEQLDSIRQLRDSASASIVDLASSLKTKMGLEEDEEDLDSINGKLKSQTSSLLPFVEKAEKLIDTIIEEGRSIVLKDIEALRERRESRLEYLAKIVDEIESGRIESRVEPKVFAAESIPTGDDLVTQLDGKDNKRSLIALLNSALKESRTTIEELEKYEKSQDYRSSDEIEELLRRIPDLLNEVNGIVLEMALLQAEARGSVIEVVDVEIGSDAAFETARCLRRDWMNARSALVDRWRQIEFFADQLESQVDLVLTGEIGNAGADNPFRIRYEDGNLRAGFRFDAPIVRQSERNAYRQSQISYQQARRSYYQFEDSIHQGLRLTLRTIDQNKVLFELDRTRLKNQIDQVKLNRANLFAPPAVGQRAGQGDTTATFLANAISGLSSRQNSFLRLWAQYEVLRRNLDFDMGTMELDPMLEWVDPGVIDQSIGLQVAAREGVGENDRFCCGMQQSQMYDQQYVGVETVVPNSEVMVEAPVMESPSIPEMESSTPELDFSPEPTVVPEAIEAVEPPPVPVPDVPNVEPVIGLPALESSQTSPAKKYIEQGPVFRTSSTTSANISRSSSSREGYLDPFRKKYGNIYSRQRLVGAPAVSAAGSGEQSATPALDQAFRIRNVQPKVVPDEKPVKADATILMR